MKFCSIRPSKRLLMLSAVVLLSAMLPILDSSRGGSGIIAYIPALLFSVLMGLACTDLYLSRKSPAIAVNRELPEILSLYHRTAISFGIANRSNEALVLEWKEKIPNDWDLVPYQALIVLDANQTQEHTYFVSPKRRGPATIEGVYLRIQSFLQLWQLVWFRKHVSEHKVYPNFTAISDLSGLQGSVNLQQIGLRKFNLRGAGMDFLQLRDYREGESLRQIDWRASSRFNKLISKEFQEEKNQHILMMVDAGRRMRVQDDELSYFEHALNAMTMLSFTALKNGDTVSIQSFGSESRWLNKVRGAQNVSLVMHHFYDLYPEKISSDYLGAAQALMLKHPKRSLVLLLSCLRDEDFEDLLIAVRLLQEKHLVAVISIEEAVYTHIDAKPINDFSDALDYASARHLKRNIEHNIRQLRHQGVICIQCPAAQLTSNMINSYLSIKKAGLL